MDGVNWWSLADPWADPLLPVDATVMAGLTLGIALVLAVSAAPRLIRASGFDRMDWLWVGGATLLALALRLGGESRVPGWINGHGYRFLASLLHSPPMGADFHGNGPWAFYGALLAFLPRRVSTILAIQAVASALMVPACWALARAFLANRAAARWTALLAATLPGFVYFGASEERLVIGLLPLVLAPALAAGAAATGSPLALLAAAAMAAAAAQFQPFLLLAPMAVGLVLIVRADGRKLLWSPWSVAAMALFAGLAAEPAGQALRNLMSGTGPAGIWVPGAQPWMNALLLPATHDNVGPTGNVFLNLRVTPIVFPLAMVLGFVALHRRRATVPAAWALLALGLLFVSVALLPGRMNTVRLQLPAQPWFLVLAGAGLAAATRFLAHRMPQIGFLAPGAVRDGVAACGGLVLLVASIACAPGPMFQVFGPQRERRVIEAGLADAPSGCVVLWSSMTRKSGTNLPLWIGREEDRYLQWGAVRDFDAPSPPFPPCTLYVRPLACHDRAVRVEGDPGNGIRAECAHLEEHLAPLTPVHMERVLAEPDCLREFPTEPVEIGVWAVGPRNEVPAPRTQ